MRGRDLRRIGMLLVVSGALLVVGPSVIVEVADRLAARHQTADVARWMRSQPAGPEAAAPQASARPVGPATRGSDGVRAPEVSGVIEPGDDGYLLEIPKLGLRAVVRQLEAEVFLGRNTPRLKRFGLGQVPYSAELRNVSPGAEGTAVIAGHRTTSGAPFRDLNRLGPGDLIVLRSEDSEQRWRVVYATIVAPEAVDAIKSHEGVRRLVIMACSPPFSAAERLLVYATLEGEGAI